MNNLLKIQPYNNPKDAIRISFGGDLYYGEYYQRRLAQRGESHILDNNDYDYSGQELKDFLNKSDHVTVCLETALTEKTQTPISKIKQYYFQANPKPTLKALKKLNIDSVSLGNNHSMDYEAEGLLDTINFLEKENISYFGAGKNLEGAERPFTQTYTVGEQTIKLAIISCLEPLEAYKTDFGFYAESNKPGVNMLDLQRIREQVTQLKQQDYFVIIQPHWEANYAYPSYMHLRFTHTLIDSCGADLVISHGTHFFSGLRKAEKGWILNSIGNLIFNSFGDYESLSVIPYSSIIQLVLFEKENEIKTKLNIYPIVSDNKKIEYQPRFVEEQEFEHFCGAVFYPHHNPEETRKYVTPSFHDNRYFLSIDLNN